MKNSFKQEINEIWKMVQYGKREGDRKKVDTALERAKELADLNRLSITVYSFYGALKKLDGNTEDLAGDRDHIQRLAQRQTNPHSGVRYGFYTGKYKYGSKRK